MSKVTKFGYAVRLSAYCDYSEHEDEAFGSWSESYSNSFRSVAHDDKYPDVVSIHDFKPGDVAYVVWAEWSTGDSFGRAERGSREALAILKNGIDAFDLQRKLSLAEDGAFKWKSSDGDTFESGYLPWGGYFDSLDEIRIETVQF